MRESNYSRRDFNKLTVAAFGGLMAGAGQVLADDKPEKDKDKDKNPLLVEPHVCRGLNTCKGKDPTKKNSCAGQGACTSVKHECRGKNECKGQGGCGATPGENACKGKGSCEVPLNSSAWKRARKRYETLMKAAGKKFGPAPKPKKSK